MSTNGRRLNRTLTSLLVITLAVLSLPLGPGPTGVALSLAADPPREAETAIFRQSASTAHDVPLAGSGEWTQALVEISGAPDDAVISYVQVKYSIVYSQPSELDVQLVKEGSDVIHTLRSGESAGGTELTRSHERIGTFRGVPVNGTWVLAVKGEAHEGYIDGFSLNAYYEAAMPILHQEAGGAPGQPGLLHLPEGVAPAHPSQGEDDKPVAAFDEGASVAALDVPPGAIIIETQDFEGSFYPPSTPPGWDVRDDSADGLERTWDDASCDQCGGDWAAWPADRGADHLNVCAGDDYPNDMFAWMIYGPFDLSDAIDAGTEFVMWREIEANYDWVFFGVSADGSNFTGVYWDGAAGCTSQNVHYSGWVGDSSVWVAWVFYSDYVVTYEGPWVDDIVIWKMPDRVAPWLDDMESGINSWVTNGLWHQVEDGVSPYPESRSPTHSWWYGQDATGDYDNGVANNGSLTSPAIRIRSDAPGSSLSFWSWYETESSGTQWDQRWVQISVDGGPFQNLAQLSGDPMQAWFKHTFDLDHYGTGSVRVRFYFTTVDANNNGHRGWYIDDVAVHEDVNVYLPVILKSHP